MYLFEDTAKIIDIVPYDTKIALILDQTIFYPQGGGQPYDQGTIKKNDGSEFMVEETRFKDGIVYHIGFVKTGTFNKGDHVTLIINQERRMFNSRNHTAGHILDIAMRNVGMHLTPGKGYHFPEGAYVEYTPTLDDQAREELKTKLQQEVDRLVEQTLPITIKLVTLQELQAMASYVPDYIPKDKPSRAMIVQGYPAIACGGTHAHNTQEVGPITIDKIKNVKGNLRVSYSIK
jgi:Ser-tRNA(Ala) deacylase AlaX